MAQWEAKLLLHPKAQDGLLFLFSLNLIMFVIFTQQMPLMTQFLYFLDISSFCISCLIFPGSEVFINDRGDVKILSFFLAKYR